MNDRMMSRVWMRFKNYRSRWYPLWLWLLSRCGRWCKWWRWLWNIMTWSGSWGRHVNFTLSLRRRLLVSSWRRRWRWWDYSSAWRSRTVFLIVFAVWEIIIIFIIVVIVFGSNVSFRVMSHDWKVCDSDSWRDWVSWERLWRRIWRGIRWRTRFLWSLTRRIPWRIVLWTDWTTLSRRNDSSWSKAGKTLFSFTQYSSSTTSTRCTDVREPFFLVFKQLRFKDARVWVCFRCWWSSIRR